MDDFTGPVPVWGIKLPDCVVCDDRGCEFCGVTVEESEPFASEAFTHFGYVDLQRLVLDAQAELYRRNRQDWTNEWPRPFDA